MADGRCCTCNAYLGDQILSASDFLLDYFESLILPIDLMRS